MSDNIYYVYKSYSQATLVIRRVVERIGFKLQYFQQCCSATSTQLFL